MADASKSLSIINALQDLRDDLSGGDPLARLQALELSRKLQAELETPGETLMKLTWAEPTHHWVVYAAQDLGIFKILSENNDASKSSTEIAHKANAEPFLIRRLMRQMAAMNSVAEVGPDSFAHSNFSRFLLTPSADSTLTFMRWWQYVEAKAPDYLKAHDYKSPSNPKRAPFSWVHDLGEITWFEYLSKDATYGPHFAAMMRAESEGKPTWSDGQLYPVKEKLTSVENPGDVLIVDIGGGSGHDIECFHKNHPELKGRLILQDLPYLTDNIKIEGIEPMAHDFFTEQPVKGAQVYFLHQISQDWDDEAFLKILRGIVPAMKPGYSKILINELILPEQGAHWFATSLDLELMLTLGARERTEAQLADIISRVGGGLRLERVYSPTVVGMLDSLIECVIDP